MLILAISGSLRRQSSNTTALQAAIRLAPSSMRVELYASLSELPFFNPDLDNDDAPLAVQALRHRIGAVDGLLICSPEYARGVAGVLKNALDWLVSSVEFPAKPVAIINTSPRATHADAALRLTLETMSARLVGKESTVLPLQGRNLDAEGIIADTALAAIVRSALGQLARVVKSSHENMPKEMGESRVTLPE